MADDDVQRRVAGTAARSSDAGGRARELELGWRGKAPPARPFNLIGAGLRLFGLRTVPMVGREEECKLFWKSFRRVAECGRPGVIVVEGAAGVGKSRLARWFCERVHELGAADCLIADHHGSESRAPGISYMLARSWSCLNMIGPELRQRVATRLSHAGLESPALHDAMAEILAPASLGIEYIPGAFHSFPSRAARYQTVLDVLRQVHDRRPVVVWMDDAHWEPDAVRFVRFAMNAAVPLLAVVTVREDLVAESPVVSELVRELVRHEHAEYLRLQPLSGQESRRLVRHLLYLDDDLAEGVAARSGGNPLYATQLVGDWVNRGTLRAGTSGFVLSAPEVPAIPNDLHAVWIQRVERVLDECAEEAAGTSAGPIPRSHLQIPLELAAALGGDVDIVEWLSVCTRVGIPDPRPVLERLLASRMASTGPDSWSFGHGMLRDTIESTARARGRWVAHNRLCADMLEELRPVPHWGDSERIGRHRFAAEEFANAWRPLLTGAKERMRTEEYATALELASLHDRALDALEVADSDPRRLSGLLLQADIRCLREELAEAGDLATRVADVPQSPQTMRLHGVASLILARVQQRQGRWNAALRSFKDAERALRRAGAGPQLGASLSEQASAMLELGLVTDAWESLHEAQQIFEDAGEFLPWMESQLNMARVVSRLGDYGQAVVLCRRVLAFANRDGLSRIEATACDALAEVQREHGDLAAAEESLNRGIQLFEALGLNRQAQGASMSRILLLLQTGAWTQADVRADELTGVPEIELSSVSRLLMSLIRLALVAVGPRAEFDQYAQQAAALLTQVERPVPSMARCLAVAIERVAHQPERQAQIVALRDLIADRLHGGTTSLHAHESG
ncbi:MAG: AAA family ATPase [Gemmatimonadota bacterium]